MCIRDRGEGLTNTHAHPAAAHGTSNAGYILVVIGYGLLGFGYVISATFLVAMTRLEPTLRFLEPVIWVPVSYTHLDVYKRQMEARADAALAPTT